jgi:hypothetical protein
MNQVRRQPKTAKGERGAFDHPPQYDACPTQVRRFRFVSSVDVTNATITASNLLSGSMLFATSSTNAAPIYTHVRLRKVEVWSPSFNVVGTENRPNTISLTWLANGGSTQIDGDGRTISDTSMSVIPAHIRTSPRKDSFQGNWQTLNGGAMFVLSARIGSVIDIEGEYRMTPDAGSSLTTVTSGLGAGQTYFGNLDGLGHVSTALPSANASLAV